VSVGSRTQPGKEAASLEADIIRQREDLAHSVDALSHKLDVKSRAHDKVTDLRASVTTGRGQPRPVLLLVTGAAVAGAVLLVWWRRRH
jgi:hypothetical protein